MLDLDSLGDTFLLKLYETYDRMSTSEIFIIIVQKVHVIKWKLFTVYSTYKGATITQHNTFQAQFGGKLKEKMKMLYVLSYPMYWDACVLWHFVWSNI